VMGSWRNGRNRVAFAFGLVIPIAVIGVLAEAPLPLTLVADAVMVAFFIKLWRGMPGEATGGPGSSAAPPP